MVWRLPEAKRQVFERNALAAVVFELRFTPILKITEGAGIPEFQDKVRATFPVYQEVESTTVNLQPQAGMPGISVAKEKRFQFIKKDASATLGLGSISLSVEDRNYTSREEFLPDVELAIEALRSVHSPIDAVRIGLRYINIVQASMLSNDLGRPVSEKDILAEDFLKLPGDLADMDGTGLSVEVRSPVKSPGEMTLRYGVGPSAGGPVCRIDMDRYLEGVVPLDGIRKMLEGFSDDMSSLFKAASGKALVEWMRPRAA